MNESEIRDRVALSAFTTILALGGCSHCGNAEKLHVNYRADGHACGNPVSIAMRSYALADAMMKARSSPAPSTHAA